MERKKVKPICGVVPPVVTPLATQNRLDESGLERLIEHMLGGGVHGLFILGTTGEGPDCSYELRRAMIERTCRQVNGRVPVLVGVTDTSYVESLALAEYAAEYGADAVVVAPPYYFSVGQPELQDYFLNLLGKLPLPAMLYNMPSCTKVSIGIETLQALLEHPNMIGFKDSSGQMVYFHQVLRLFSEYPKKTILVGPEELLAESVLIGAHGGVSGGANVFPKLYVELYDAARTGDLIRARRLHELVIRVTDLYRIGRHTSSTIKGIKAALNCLGVCSDLMQEPFCPFRTEDRNRVQALLDKLLPEIPMGAEHLVFAEGNQQCF